LQSFIHFVWFSSLQLSANGWENNSLALAYVAEYI